MSRIKSETDLKLSIQIVNEELQKIQDYLGRDKNDDGKIKFPRKYLKTVNAHMGFLPHLANDALKRNIAYTAVMIDVLKWLIIRTDIAFTPREMIIKTAIILLVSMVEAVTNATVPIITCKLGKISKPVTGYKERVKILYERKIISEEVRDVLKKAWALRGRVHIPVNGEVEINIYNDSVYNEILNAYEEMCNSLKKYISQR